MPDRRSNSTAIIDLTASSPPRPLTDALIDAINTAPPKELRSALKRTCESSKEAWKLVKKILLVRRTRVQHKIVKRKLDSEGTIGSTDEDQSGSGGEDEGGSESEDSQEKDVDRGTSGHCNGSLLSAVKRYRPRFATCENCNEDFDVTNNDEDACVWHPGDKEPDYDSEIWADHDERCHGVIADLGDEYPEGFIYDCCERRGDNEGCKIGTHVEEELANKRARFY